MARFEPSADGRRAMLPGILSGVRAQTAPQAAVIEAQANAPLFGAARSSVTQQISGRAIGQEEIRRAALTLSEYKRGKANLENRIIDDELWWEMRHWESIRKGKSEKERQRVDPEPTSAWLFNALINKHADAMDNMPEAAILPRERSDEGSAKTLSSVIPVVMENCCFDQTYSELWDEKLKHGFGVYGVFWDSDKENGLGDIDIHLIDALKIFWEPGVTDLQRSRNVFLLEVVDTDILDQTYPEHAGQMGGNLIDVAKYLRNDMNEEITNKSVVVDWYYKTVGADGRTRLHFCKFVNDVLLFASENEPDYAETGWYAHGKYPFVPDVLFREKSTWAGFGYIAVCKEPQLFIDKLMGNILETSMMCAKRRYFVSASTNVNREQFLDVSEPIVQVEGELSDMRIKEMQPHELSPVYLNLVNLLIEQMKDTAGNRDVNSGGTGSGVTAAAAIAALQEAGNKLSRDAISGSYRAYTEVVKLVIEDMRQFYDETRVFRITNELPYEYAEIGKELIGNQFTGVDGDGTGMIRRPVFDVKVSAHKRNPFSRAEQNERAKELYGLGFFSPERAQESLGALEMMDFEGIAKVKDYIKQGQTLENMLEQYAAIVQQLTGVGAAQGGTVPAAETTTPGSVGMSEEAKAQQPMTGYGTQLAKRSAPDMDTGAGA